MKDAEKTELEKFMLETADGDPRKAAANAEILARFAKAALAAPAGARARVKASLEPSARPRLRRAAPALALGAAALLAVILLRPAGAPQALVSPDWRSYDNFSCYADEGRMYVNALSPDWRGADSLVSSADYGPGL